jgi:GIY-YIG catalytic domain
MSMNEADFFQRNPLFSPAEVIGDRCPVPREPGVYAWFFREIPPRVPTVGCFQREGLTLLYVGISPQKPGKRPGKKPSRETIQSRLRDHMVKQNAEGSTVRMTLGCLLSDTLGIRLELPGNHFTFGAGEATLSEWISRNAFVTWTEHREPWLLEDRLIADLVLPLNIRGNSRHPFYATLRKIRREAKAAARALSQQ